ncbi:talin-2-like [Sinocyclocheilus grahami]|uniref:talin-2-like n=1 Tax=Sinocyclocheilus grahami TaxID=75366 RepID=UPI0007AD1ACE|nr:PREDICTED: talin-2-like [Sinocyclocheilus grahami]
MIAASDYGLFLSDDDPRKGIWLESGRTLDYYMLRNGDILEYKKKQRPQKIKMLDGAIKTIMVDDSKTVGELLVTICSRIGITNYEEYSLIQEQVEEKREDGMGTLKKDRTLLRDERKMEKLKAKLHTDDDLNWLDHSWTFREQGVEESEILLLRRKFFYSDQNVDSRDPVQLNLLYVQDHKTCGEMMEIEAKVKYVKLARSLRTYGVSFFLVKPGFLDLKEFLPKEYIKQRGAEKRIFQDHKTCGEMMEIEAKVKYVKLARSLRTYGVSFFLVKEKMKSKNKLVPRLLGITKESVMRVEEKTKEVVQEWPLTTVKRWAASPKSFTLDFGEYQESYYSVQTTEGEQISQLIAGYIDIILKKKQSKDRFGLDGDEESTMLEESVSPKKSTILQQQFNRVGRVEHGSVALPGIMRSGSIGGPDTFNMGTMPSAQQQITTGQMHRGHMPPLSLAQQALMGTINTSMQAVQQAQADLGEVDNLPPLGQDMASRMWVQNKVDESKHEIHSQVDAITAGTASVVNLTAGFVCSFLRSGELPCGPDQPRQTVLSAASSIGQASGDLLKQMGEGETDERFQDIMMNLAKAVANAAAMLVLKAKNVAQVAEDTALQNRVITAATQCALSTSQLVACTKVVSPTISSPVCQEQLVEAGRLVERSVEGCVKACHAASEEGELIRQVNMAAGAVSQALSDLLQHVRHYASCGEPIGRYDQATDTIMTVTENIFTSMGDAGSHLSRGFEGGRGRCSFTPSTYNPILLKQSSVVSPTISSPVCQEQLVEAGRLVERSVEGCVKACHAASEEGELIRQVNMAAGAVSQALSDLLQHVRHYASCGEPIGRYDQATDTIMTGAAAYPENEDQQQRLREAAEGLRVATNAAAQNAIKKKLIHRLEAHEACGPLEIDSALSAVQTLKSELQDAKMATLEGQLKPLPGQSLEKCAQDLGSTSKAVGSSMAQLLTCAAQGNEHYTGVAARETAQALRTLAQAARGVAASTVEPKAAAAMLDSACHVMEGSAMLIHEADQALVCPGDAESQQRLAQVAKAVSHSLNNCVNCLPGQKDVDMALRSIGEASKKLLVENLPPCSKSFQEAQTDLNHTAAELNHSAGDVVQSSRGSSSQLAVASGKFSQDFDEFLDAGIEMAGHTQSKDDQIQVIGNLKNISMASSKLLLAAKSLSVDPGAANAKNLLAAAASYLVGVSDPNSQSGHQGLVDPIQFARANQAIQMACQNLVDPASSPSQVLSAATIVAKHTSALCNACRLASSKAANPVARRHFVQSAKEVANTTANLVKTIKALDGDFSDENRERCRVATTPLIEAVDNLSTFASNPEFASIPAQISHEGSAAQEPILRSARSMLDSSTHLLETARSLILNPKDPPTWSILAGHSRTVSDSIKSLITSIRDKAPGQRECDQSIDSMNKSIRDIEQVSLAAVSQSLPCRDDISMEALQEQLTSAVQEIGHLIDPISTAARGEAAQLGHKVTQLASYFEPVIVASVGLASKHADHQQQMNILDQTKTLFESALQMLYAAKEGGGNPKASHTHDAIAEAAQLMKEAVDDIMVTLNEAASEGGMVGGMVESIAESIGRMDEGTPPEPDGTFVDYQTTMVKFSKAIAITAQEMMTKSVTCPEELGGLASQVTVDYSQLAQQGRLAAATAEPEEVGSQIKTRVQELGHGCIYLVQKAGALQMSPTDSFTKRELIEYARAVTEKVSMVLSALQAGNKGTQACITAASSVSGIIADLDTTIMFASAGTLNAENEESFADHRENILKTAKALVEDTKLLVSGAASSQDKLAQAAQSSAKTITQLTDVVKLGAASMGSEDPETQVVLINAIRDVAKALAELISATKCAAGKAADDPSMYQLKSAAKVMVTNVTSLLKTVKAVEDEATRGTRALEATIECIKQELTVFQSKDVPEKSTTPEEFIRMTKGITVATAKAVAAGNSTQQEDVISTANLSRKAISDMLTTCKQAAYHPEVGEDVRNKALLYGIECTARYTDLLEHVLLVLQKPTAEQKQQLVTLSKKVAGSVTELIQTAEAMKDGGSEWVDPEDPTVIAETELLGAAASIEAAAKKLEQLKPRAKPKQADESLDFEEQILEAAKSIAAATSALVKSASAAQRELVAQGKVGSIPANAVDDGQWSQGLISAARMVAAATSSLCEAANASVQGHASEEKLISSAKQVAASTAQLLVACKVKANQDSEAMRRLQAAGNAVKRASDNLVKAAQKAAFDKSEDNSVVVKTKFVGGIAQIIAAQEEMLRKERELEEARKKLAHIRQQQYKFLPSELREDQS